MAERGLHIDLYEGDVLPIDGGTIAVERLTPRRATLRIVMPPEIVIGRIQRADGSEDEGEAPGA